MTRPRRSSACASAALVAAALALVATAAAGRERLVEVRLDRPGAGQVVVAGSIVTRTDRVCGDSPAPMQRPCPAPATRTRSWALTDAERAELERTLAATGLFAADDEVAADAATGAETLTAILGDAGHVRVVRRVLPDGPGDAAAFASVAGALTSLVPPTVVEAPAVYRGILPQRAEVELMVEAEARYRLTLRIVPLHGRPAGGASESGQWAFDPDTATIRLTPNGASAATRSAVLTGGPHPQVLLGLEGYFPAGTRVELAAAER
jgi:hypothetical protein